MVADTIFERRSIRKFSSDVVPEQTIRDLLNAAVHAPTAMHAEPWLFAVIQNRGILQKLSDAAKAIMLRQPEPYRDLHDPNVIPPNGGFLKALGDPGFNIFYNAGTLILICARQTNPFVSADCWLAAENVMLAASAMGLGTCCIGSALVAANSREGKSELGIPADVAVVAAIIVGVPDERDRSPRPHRKPPQVISWKR